MAVDLGTLLGELPVAELRRDETRTSVSREGIVRVRTELTVVLSTAVPAELLSMVVARESVTLDGRVYVLEGIQSEYACQSGAASTLTALSEYEEKIIKYG